MAVSVNTDAFYERFRGEYLGRPFDVPFMSHITGNLYVGGCRSGLILPDAIKHVISLHPRAAYASAHPIKSTMAVYLEDEPRIDNPSVVLAAARWVAACLSDGQTLVHCQAGINRSAMVAALALVKAGLPPVDAIALIRQRRSPVVLANPVFEDFVMHHSLDDERYVAVPLDEGDRP